MKGQGEGSCCGFLYLLPMCKKGNRKWKTWIFFACRRELLGLAEMLLLCECER